MKNILLVCSLLYCAGLWAQREKKLENLLSIDTAQVVVQNANNNNVPYQEKTIPLYGNELVVTRRFFVAHDFRNYYDDIYQYNNIQFDKKNNIFVLSPIAASL